MIAINISLIRHIRCTSIKDVLGAYVRLNYQITVIFSSEEMNHPAVTLAYC